VITFRKIFLFITMLNPLLEYADENMIHNISFLFLFYFKALHFFQYIYFQTLYTLYNTYNELYNMHYKLHE